MQLWCLLSFIRTFRVSLSLKVYNLLLNARRTLRFLFFLLHQRWLCHSKKAGNTTAEQCAMGTYYFAPGACQKVLGLYPNAGF